MSKKSEGMKEIEKEVDQEIKLLEEAEKAAYVTAAELMQEDEQPREVYIPVLKKKIRVREIQFGDYPELVRLQAEKDAWKISVRTLLLTWGRADPTVTEDFLARFSLKKVIAILEALGLGGKIPLSKPTQTSPT